MFEFLIPLLCVFLYMMFRPRHIEVMMINSMWFEYPNYIDVSLIRNFQPLLEWQRNMRLGLLSQGAVLEKVTIRDAYMFGSRIGFILMDVTVYMNGVKLPGAVLLRGKSIAVLVWYRDLVTKALHVVLVRQPRVATGRVTWEVPAGMADGRGTLTGQMFKELKEETGLTININDLVHHAFETPYTSSGLLDETLELYSMQVSPDVMKGLVDKPHGNTDEGEVITNVCAVPLTDTRALEDGKLRILLSSVKM
tara:strand:+ start:4711 stop:5463 length:753 start_codon:yes stop_codon:yes gene_type:complete